MKLENFKNGYDVTVGSSLAVNEKNDCAVRAFANAFSITYNEHINLPKKYLIESHARV